MKKFLFILTTTVLGVVACNEREQTSSLIQDNENISLMESLSGRIFNQSQIDNIGVLHNHYLSEAISNVNFDSDNIQDEINNVFYEITSNGLELTQSEKENLLNSSYDYEFISSHLSNSALSLIDESIDYVNNTDNFTFFEFQEQIDLWELIANNSLDEKEIDAILIYLSVLEKSAEFWMPTDLGGSGEGTPTVANASASDNIATWKRCLIADAVGATGVFLQIGLALCATPVTLTALAAAVGFGAAYSSLCAVIF